MDKYQVNLIETFSLKYLSKDKADKFIDFVGEKIMQLTIVRVFSELNSSDIELFQKIMNESDGYNDMETFLSRKSINFFNLFQDISLAYKLEIDEIINILYEPKSKNDEELYESSAANSIGMQITSWIARIFWGVLGFIFWIPLIVRIIAAFCATLVYNMVIHNPAAIQKSRISLDLAITFYKQGFAMIDKTTSGSNVNMSFSSNPDAEFNIGSFIGQVIWTLIFWGILIFPFYRPFFGNT